MFVNLINKRYDCITLLEIVIRRRKSLSLYDDVDSKFDLRQDKSRPKTCIEIGFSIEIESLFK